MIPIRPLRFKRSSIVIKPIPEPPLSVDDTKPLSNVLYGRQQYWTANGEFCFYREDGEWMITAYAKLLDIDPAIYYHFCDADIPPFPRLQDAINALTVFLQAEEAECV